MAVVFCCVMRRIYTFLLDQIKQYYRSIRLNRLAKGVVNDVLHSSISFGDIVYFRLRPEWSEHETEAVATSGSP